MQRCSEGCSIVQLWCSIAQKDAAAALTTFSEAVCAAWGGYSTADGAASGLVSFQWSVLSLDLSVPHWTVLPIKSKFPVLRQPCAASASGRIFPIASCATLEVAVYRCLDCLWMCLFCSSLVLPLDVSVIKQPVLAAGNV